MTAPTGKVTPAMKQFHTFKQKHPDCIMFFRMGDFYETFYEDAKICSKVCGLTLTSRSKGVNPIPLAGVPYHAIDRYLKKIARMEEIYKPEPNMPVEFWEIHNKQKADLEAVKAETGRSVVPPSFFL